MTSGETKRNWDVHGLHVELKDCVLLQIKDTPSDEEQTVHIF